MLSGDVARRELNVFVYTVGEGAGISDWGWRVCCCFSTDTMLGGGRTASHYRMGGALLTSIIADCYMSEHPFSSNTPPASVANTNNKWRRRTGGLARWLLGTGGILLRRFRGVDVRSVCTLGRGCISMGSCVYSPSPIPPSRNCQQRQHNAGHYCGMLKRARVHTTQRWPSLAINWEHQTLLR